MILNCKECNTEFRTYPSKIKIGRGKYCSRACSDRFTLIKKGQRLSTDTEFKPGQMPYQFKGYRYTQSRKTSGVYKMLYMPEHPYCTSSGHVREHRYVMEQVLGRYLETGEIVHHLNGKTLDNRPENLEVMAKADHDRMNVGLNVHRRWLNRKTNTQSVSC